MLHFDCDYMEGAHPEIMRRLLETNLEQTAGYGCDDYCTRAKELIRDACGVPEAAVHLFIGGTATNSTVIDGLLARHEGVVATQTGHINVHEAGAIESCGHKIIALPSHDGKICPEELDNYITDFYRDETYEHCVAPGMVYVSFPTELGSIYSREELEKISSVCHKHRIPLYLDGARLGYGLASPSADLEMKDIARLCDVFYIGGTKVGAMFGEALVVTNPGLLPHFFPLMKQHGAVLAKGRLLGIQFETLFKDGLYHRISEHAIAMAMKLKEGFIAKGYRAQGDSPTNQQFFYLDNKDLERLQKIATFELWGPKGEKETLVRFVCSWATREEDVDALINAL